MKADSATGLAGAAPAARAASDAVPNFAPARAGGRLAGPWWLAGAAVVALTALGAAIRLVVAHDSLFADELSTYWIVRTHGLGGVISTVHSNDEITPPLYFVLAWLTTKAGNSPELLRAPSLVAGIATIPLVYRLGLRTVGCRPALVAAALTALAPFMVYYSAEARAYGLMMALTVGSTLAMLVAVDTRRARWWVVYAACSAAAVYSHYTSAFVLAAQLVWLLWAHPQARRPAILANVGAAIAFAPWTTGLINDFTSPTSRILTALSPFTPHDVQVVLEHWTVGYPYSTLPLRHLPGRLALVLFGLALVVAAAGIVLRVLRDRARAWIASVDRRLLLVVVLFLSVPVGEGLASAVSTHLFGVRNLAPAWPAFALVLATALVAAGPWLRLAAVGLAVASFAIGAAKMLESRYQRPDFRDAAGFIDRHAAPRDVVIDATANLSPGPYSPLDLTLERPRRVLRADAPQERDHPFNVFDPNVPLQTAVFRAVAAASGGRVFFLKYAGDARVPAPRFPARYRIVADRTFPGFVSLALRVYAARAPSR